MEERLISFSKFIAVVSGYNSLKRYSDYSVAIQKAVRNFKDTYAKLGEKRISETKKKPLIKFSNVGFYVSLDFNKKHYGQYYLFDGYNNFKLPTINY